MPTDVAESASADAVDSSGAATLIDTWAAPAAGPPDSYNIYEGPAQGAETLLASVPGTQTLLIRPNAPLGSRWTYVTAVYAGAESAAGSEVNVLVLPALTLIGTTTTDILLGIPTLPPGVASFDLQRAVNLGGSGSFGGSGSSGFPGSWSTVQPAVAPNAPYDDPGLSQRSRFFYRLAATNAAGTQFFGPQFAAETTTMTDEQHFFSTGNLSVTYLDPNVGANVTVPFAKVQGIDFNMDWAAHLLYDAAQNAVFPVDCAFDDGKFTVKAQHVGISADQLTLLAGLQLNVAGNPVIDTIQAVSFPKNASLSFTGQDTKGRTITITLNNVVSKGFSLPFKINDWAMDDVELHAIKDANGNIGTITAPQ